MIPTMSAAIPTLQRPADEACAASVALAQRCSAHSRRHARHSCGQSSRPPTVRALPLIPLVMFWCACAGCSWTDKHGTQHVLIIGCGIVSQTNHSGIIVRQVRGLGLVVDDAVDFGLVQRHRVEIDPQLVTNAIFSVHSTPFTLSLEYGGKTNSMFTDRSTTRPDEEKIR
jgi:hypothetical protein